MNEESFIADLLAGKDLEATLLAWADWCREKYGADDSLGYALEWAARRGLFPYLTAKTRKAHWFATGSRRGRVHSNCLPRPIWNLIPKSRKGGTDLKTAFLRLCYPLQHLKGIVQLG